MAGFFPFPCRPARWGRLTARFCAIERLHRAGLKGPSISIESRSSSRPKPCPIFHRSSGTKEYESVLRSRAQPSHLHFALLMLGLEPGQPVRFDEAQKQWIPPRGPPLKLSCEFVRNGKTVVVPASRLMRSVKEKAEMP